METCARCGAGFICGNVEGAPACWCSQLPAVLPVPEGPGGCLCPSCLRAAVLARVGDCLDCAHARTLATRGSMTVFLCGRADAESGYPRYPVLPVASCPGLSPKPEITP